MMELMEFLSGDRHRIETPRQAGTDDAILLAGHLQDWFMQERELQWESRLEMAEDADFYDGEQWTAEELKELKERNQAPSVVNLILPVVQWIIGAQKRNRAEWKIVPTTADGLEDAQLKQRLLKTVLEDSYGHQRKSSAFESSMKSGLAWRELGVRGDNSDMPLFIGYESWRNIHYDSSAKDPMFVEDGRYIFRRKLVDLDIACAKYPEFKDMLKAAATSVYDTDYDYSNEDIQLYAGRSPGGYGTASWEAYRSRRRAVPLVEAWYRAPVKVKSMRGVEGYRDGTVYDETDEAMRRAVEAAKANAALENARASSGLFDMVRMQMFVAVFIDPADQQHVGRLLFNCKSPYRHNRFPFVPMWAYRRDRDGTPFGVVRNMKSPQRDFNKRHSKAQFILATRGVVYDEGAVDDEDKMVSELARPDFAIAKRKGYDLELHDDHDLAPTHINISNLDREYIREASGVTGENLGLSTNAISGTAIARRQEEGTTITQSLFDNLRYHDQACGEIALSLVEQFMLEPMLLAMDTPNGLAFTTVNEQTEDGVLNDISARKARFVVGEQDYHATMRAALTDSLMELMTHMEADVAMQLLDVVIDMTDVPQRQEIVRRIRLLNGMPDPSSMTAEDMQRMDEERKRQEYIQGQMQMEKTLADTGLTKAKTAKAQADAAQWVSKAFMQALEASGIMLVANPAQTGMAEQMIDAAGSPKPMPTLIMPGEEPGIAPEEQQAGQPQTTM